MDENIMGFIEKSTYYKTSLHMQNCRICKLPRVSRIKIDEMILNGTEFRIIKGYLVEQYPAIFKDEQNGHVIGCVRKHAEYLPYLLDDVQVKTIFKKARDMLKDVNFDNLNSQEKAVTISKIESEMMKEYSDMEHERMSLLHVMFRQTLPMMMERLNDTILGGKTKEINDLANASNTIFKITTALSMPTTSIDDRKEEGIADDRTISSNEKIVSLADKIKQATEGRQAK